MTYAEHAPTPELRRHVLCLWSLSSDGTPHRVLPDGAMDLVFGAAGLPEGRLVGVMTRALVTAPGAPHLVLGVRFRPGGAAALLGLDARDTRDERVLLADAFGAPGRVLEGRVLDALGAGVGPAVGALERALLTRLGQRTRPIDPRLAAAVATIDRARGAVATPALARGVGLTERHLERLFNERVGIGPKAYARVVRMRAAVGALDAGAPAAAVAAELGYADQPHLIREVRLLTGITPAARARARGAPTSGVGEAARLVVAHSPPL